MALNIDQESLKSWLSHNGYDPKTEAEWIKQVARVLYYSSGLIRQFGIKGTLDAITSGDRSVYDSNPLKPVQEYDEVFHNCIAASLQEDALAINIILHLGGIKAVVEEVIKQCVVDTMNRESLANTIVVGMIDNLWQSDPHDIWRERQTLLPGLVSKILESYES